MKTVYLIPLIYILFNGCGVTSTVQRNPSTHVLISIQPNSETAGFLFSSSINEPYECKFGTGFFEMDVNNAYRNNLKTYIQTKFANSKMFETQIDTTYIIEFTLNKFEVTYENVRNTGETISSIIGIGEKGAFRVMVEMLIYVQVKKNNIIIAERKLPSYYDYQEDFSNGNTYNKMFASAVNSAFDNSLIIIDKYLVSNGI